MIEHRIDLRTEQTEQFLREIHYQLIRLSRHELANLRMTPPRFHALHYIVRHAPTDMGSMHMRMHVSKSSLTSLVDGLVDDGLIRRDRSEEDRRRVVLRPTQAGIELLERLRRSRCAHLQQALEQVDDASADCLARSLEQIFQRLQLRNEQEAP
jgi:MarR family transcriptional regulator, organic hydroperoxide resistance regulator